LIAALLAAVALAGDAGATAALATLESDELVLVHRAPLQSHLAPQVARCFYNSLEFQERVFGWEPSKPVTVLINDFSDSGNASAMGTPRTVLLLETSPIGMEFETVSPNERFNWLMNHELVHLATVDKATKADRRWRTLFAGKVVPTAEQPETILWFWLTSPRDAAPRWFHEGIAVFAETWMAGGLGRAQGSWDEMVFRTKILENAALRDPLGLVAEGVKTDFQVDVNSYLYGTRFISWLALTYSPDHVVRWIRRDEGSKRYYASQFRQVFGMSLDEAWAKWTAFEREFQAANLASIRAYPVTKGRDLVNRPLGSVSRLRYDERDQRLILAVQYPGSVAFIGSLPAAGGELKPIVDVKAPILYAVTSLAWDGARRKIFYTTDHVEYRDLREVDPDTGESRTLLKDARIGELAFDPVTRELWGVRHFNGMASIVTVPEPYTEWKLARAFPYGEVPRNLAVSPDGALVAAAIGEADGGQVLRVYRAEDLRKGEATPVAERRFGVAAPLDFDFTPDGRYLMGSAYYTGVANVLRWDWKTDALAALTNAETGYFRPLPTKDGRLFAIRYAEGGFVPVELDGKEVPDLAAITFLGTKVIETHPELKGWNVGPPSEIPIETLVKRQGSYRSGRGIGVESVYPVLQGYKESIGVGARVNLSDPLMLNRISLTASYTPDSDLAGDEKAHADLHYERYDWRARATYNYADFYDLFGPTKRSRKGWSIGAGWGRTLIDDRPRRLRLDVDAAYFGDLERLPFYQNVAAPDKLASLVSTLEWSNARTPLGGVDAVKGQRASLSGAVDRAGGEMFPKLVATWDGGLALPLSNSSVWLRTAAGAAAGDRDNELASFYFGGFGNNWVDHGDEKKYRDWWGFPGEEINALAGRTFAKVMTEWNLPPLRFARAGSPGIYASWARTSIFATGIETDLGDAALRRRVGNVGVQVDVRFTILSRLDMTLSFGYASAFEEGTKPRDEGMVSLRVLR
jgi:hypothetical protein